jgi:hypothetical protein
MCGSKGTEKGVEECEEWYSIDEGRKSNDRTD